MLHHTPACDGLLPPTHCTRGVGTVTSNLAHSLGLSQPTANFFRLFKMIYGQWWQDWSPYFSVSLTHQRLGAHLIRTLADSMEKEPRLDALEDPSASAAVYVVLPDAEDGALGGSNEPPPQRPWWLTSLALRRGQSAPALTRLTGGGDGEGRQLRHTHNMGDAITSGSQLRDGFHPTRALLRALSSLTDATREQVAEKFRCYICFNDVPLAMAVTLSSCGHHFCQSCFHSYLSSKISEGHVHPVCFHPLDSLDGLMQQGDEQHPRTGGDGLPHITCGVAVSDEQIQSIVDADVWAKLNKFRFTQEHQHARECPHCSFTQECAGPSNPACVCTQCEKQFCFFHGNAHQYGTCGDYELKIAEAEALNRAVINEVTKPCPGCSRDIEKDGGCNHMTCVACQTSFCWLCGEAIESVVAHYDPAGEGACSGKQADGIDRDDYYDCEHGFPEEPRSAMIAFVICITLAFLVVCPFSLVTALIVWPFKRDQDYGDAYLYVFEKMLEGPGCWIFYTLNPLVRVIVIVVEFVVKLAVFLFTAAKALFMWTCKPGSSSVETDSPA